MSPSLHRILTRSIVALTLVAVTVGTVAPMASAAPSGDGGRVLATARQESALREQVRVAVERAQAQTQQSSQRRREPAPGTPGRAEIKAGMHTMVADGAIGVVARVASPRFDFAGAAGKRDKDWSSGDWRARPTPYDRFRVASQTKTMVATLVLQEVQRGRWKLDQRVAEIMPGIFPGHEYVTFRQLLSHTSGAPNGSVELLMANITDPNSPEQVLAALGRDYSAQDHLDVINAVPWTAPGEYLYSNAGYVALGRLLEVQNRRPLEHLLRTRVWWPSGMWATSLPDEPGLRVLALREDAWSGEALGWTELDGFDPDFFLASGAAVSTTADLTRFQEALVRGRLVSPKLLDEMLATSGPGDYGLGIYRIPDPCAAPGTAWLYGHDGASYGTLSITLSSPDGRRQVSLAATGRDLSNPLEPRWNLGDALVPMLLATC